MTITTKAVDVKNIRVDISISIIFITRRKDVSFTVNHDLLQCIMQVPIRALK